MAITQETLNQHKQRPFSSREGGVWESLVSFPDPALSRGKGSGDIRGVGQVHVRQVYAELAVLFIHFSVEKEKGP